MVRVADVLIEVYQLTETPCELCVCDLILSTVQRELDSETHVLVLVLILSLCQPMQMKKKKTKIIKFCDTNKFAIICGKLRI